VPLDGFAAVSDLSCLIFRLQLIAVNFICTIQRHSLQKLFIFLLKQHELSLIHFLMPGIFGIDVKKEGCEVSIKGDLSDEGQRVDYLSLAEVAVTFVGE
jgi:hypothetical protein